MDQRLSIILLLLNLLCVVMVIVAYTWFRKILMNNTDKDMAVIKKMIRKPVALMIACIAIITVIVIILLNI